MRNNLLKSGVIFLLGLSLTGLQAQTVKDIDGNVYKTLKIGKLEWMAENLRTTKYNDGDAIPLVQGDEPRSGLANGSYTIYTPSRIRELDSETEVFEAYGVLYNWFAVETGKLCPADWRVPTDEEWTTLTDYIEGDAGGKLKSTRITPDAHPRWESPNTGATDKYGFSALPGGMYVGDGIYTNIGYSGHWWTSTSDDARTFLKFAWYRSITFDSSDVKRYSNQRQSWLSVRCVRDQN